MHPSRARTRDPNLSPQFGRIDILVNNAGISRPERIDSLTDANWSLTIASNLTSAVQLTHLLAPAMAERGWGRIINVSSIFGLVSYPGRTSYAASKHALLGVTKTHAVELGSSGVTCNAIAPGPFLTDMPKASFSEEQQQKVASAIPAGRWGQPHELAGACVLLASPAGDFINGATLVVDGGYTCQ